MFRDKYVYTCPDVIHYRAMQRRKTKNAIIGNLVGLALTWAVGAILVHKADAQLAKDIENATDQEN